MAYKGMQSCWLHSEQQPPPALPAFSLTSICLCSCCRCMLLGESAVKALTWKLSDVPALARAVMSGRLPPLVRDVPQAFIHRCKSQEKHIA